MTEAIKDILECDKKIYMAITGGGTRAISDLLENGGASSVFDGARIPYSVKDLCDFVGSVMGIYSDIKCCSKDMAENMAIQSRWEIFGYNKNTDHIVGLGCTASLRKNKDERKGRVNRAFICVIDTFNIIETHIVFHNKDKYHTISRRDQEDMLSTLILSALADFVNGSPHYIESHSESNPYVWVTSEGHKLGE